MSLPILCPPSLQKLIQACSVDKWAVVNFSARCVVPNLIRDLMRNASAKGIVCSVLSHKLCQKILFLTFSFAANERPF